MPRGLSVLLLATLLAACTASDPALEAASGEAAADPATPETETNGSEDTEADPDAATADDQADAPAQWSATPPPIALTPEPYVARPPLAGRSVAIDPGHNGGNRNHPEIINQTVDAGGFQKACNTVGTATDGGYSEARFNFEVALLVRERLESLGADVHLSRDDNEGVGPCIDERGRFAGEAGADVLVSIHADGGPPAGHGFHVIRPGLVPGHTDHVVESSALLADALRDALLAAGFTPATYTGTAGLVTRTDLGTLNRSDVPAVLVEAGNMRNAAEAALLTSAEGQQRIAEGLVEGIRRFLDAEGGS